MTLAPRGHGRSDVGSAYAHFIGIGGAGMSGIAKVLHDRGKVVTGSDLKAGRYATALQKAGIPVHIGHDAAALGDPEVVVISSAIPESNPELAEARRRGIEVWPRAKMLAHLAGTDKTLAVAGTHGKTTTSSMLAMTIDGLGLDPTFLIGGELNDMGSNARCGSGGYYVVESDESDGSFLYMDPFVALVTNIEADHLDHYKDLDDVVRTFAAFMGKVSPDGAAVVCGEDPHAPQAARRSCPGRVVTYGRTEPCDVRCADIERVGIGHRFTVTFPDKTSCRASVKLPGVHNVLNATGVLAACWALGLDVKRAAEALAGFSGVRRRFDHVGEVAGVQVVDDYAHHPTEIRATLAGAREAGFKRIWVVFQPHRYSRTASLGAEFGAAFDAADHLVLMDVYSAGETPLPGVSGKTVLDAFMEHAPHRQAAYFPHRAEIAPYVAERLRSGDVLLTMGAGDVSALGPQIVRELEQRKQQSEAASCR